ncbi:hypothetical protein LXL04_014309 [Taraxacum kok-saghyz]
MDSHGANVKLHLMLQDSKDIAMLLRITSRALQARFLAPQLLSRKILPIHCIKYLELHGYTYRWVVIRKRTLELTIYSGLQIKKNKYCIFPPHDAKPLPLWKVNMNFILSTSNSKLLKTFKQDLT